MTKLYAKDGIIKMGGEWRRGRRDECHDYYMKQRFLFLIALLCKISQCS